MKHFLQSIGITVGIGLVMFALIKMTNIEFDEPTEETMVGRIAERNDFTLETMLGKYIQLNSQHRRMWGIWALHSTDEQLRNDVARMRVHGILPPEPFTMYFQDTAFTFDFGAITTRLIDSIDWGEEYSKEYINARISDVTR